MWARWSCWDFDSLIAMNPAIPPSTYEPIIGQNGLFNNQSRKRKILNSKPVVDLETNGLHQTIPAQDMLQELHPHNPTKLWD